MQTNPSLIRALAAAGLALVLGQPAMAADASNFRFDTTKDLDAVCSVPETAAEYAVAHQACRAFIEATVQYHDEVTNRKALKPLVCYPPNTTIEDGKAAFLAWAATKTGDTKLLGEPPVVGVVRALAAKYPCKKKS
jgi:hypothetical protein